MRNQSSITKKHVCFVNVGLFRSGTTTLCKAAKSCGFMVHRNFTELPPEKLRAFLQCPETTVKEWYKIQGKAEILRLVSEYGIICDGWVALLPFLGPAELKYIVSAALGQGTEIKFMASMRSIEATVTSELHHWTVHDLERKAGLSDAERAGRESSLRQRAIAHRLAANHLHKLGLLELLPLEDNVQDKWSRTLWRISEFSRKEWRDAFFDAWKQNGNPELPIEGLLLTMRLGKGAESKEKIHSVNRLLSEVEGDHLCRYLVVLAIDADESESDPAQDLFRRIKERVGPCKQLKSFHLVVNSNELLGSNFAICRVWDEMATVAWMNGADWVVLLGDDVSVRCPYHYRAIYRAFLNIEERLKVSFFGCPWWNDISFPGFPSFPCVGKTHFEIFGSLIPKHRLSNFINQDLDPYLHHLYLKFLAAPCVKEAKLVNGSGGHLGSSCAPRYHRIGATGWRDFVLDDHELIRKCLPLGTPEAILLDVVVPSYRIDLEYLSVICSLRVPQYMRTLFILIVDNPDLLLKTAAEIAERQERISSLGRAESVLEEYLSRSGNRIRVRCNQTNVGASASRNRGIDESAAEFILNLDDDLKPNPDLLEKYGQKLLDMDDDVVGLVGLVRFPRSPNLPLRHAAVLMSYLTFMFEIAERSNMYHPHEGPAWGVTANILFRRTKVRFDLAYAKTGGGEDVDFSLNVTKATCGGKLLAVPEAEVVHPFWPGSLFALSCHFFNWANGDGALFKRFPEYRYWSYPNLPETLLFVSPICLWFDP